MRGIVYFIIYKLLYKLFWILPIKKNRVLFSSYFGRQYSDNPKFIYEELIKNRNDLDIIWILNSKVEELQGHNVKIINAKSWKYLYYLATSKYWIDNCHGYHLRKPRVKTILLQTWHGTPLKKIAQDIEGKQYKKSRKNWKLESSYWDFFLSPNKNLNNLFCKAFKINEEIVINTMYPRNEFLVHSNIEKVKKKVFKELGIKTEKKIILYAPTFRVEETASYKLHLDMKRLEKEFGDKYIFLIRLHPNIKRLDCIELKKEFSINASKYNDIQELYLISDVLITDYSSVFFDYAILNKPMIFYPYDYDEYKNDDRGFYFEYSEIVPGPIVYDEENLIKEMKRLECNMSEFQIKIKKFNDKYNDVKNNETSKYILKKIGLLV
ncbi:MAG: CDP-glycerol glycerophosphotransferase family protein [Fusobacteriaceae bacterium]